MKSFLPYLGLFVLAISTQNSIAQTQFQKTTNAGSNDRNYHLTSLPSGALYATGYTDAVSVNKDDAFVVRFNAFGEVEWAKTYGDQQDDYSWDLIALNNGDLLGAGYSFSFGTPMGAATLTRIDSTGKVVWLTGLFNLTYGIDFYRAYETSTGHLLAGGLMQSASNSDEIVLCKFTPKGQFLWAKTIGTSGSDELMGITETSEGHYLLSGLMNSTNGFGSSDFGVVKLDTSGSMIWNKLYGGSNGDRLNDAIQIGNAYYFMGWSSSDGQGSNDVVLMKTDTAGKVSWTKFYGSSGGDLAFNMKFDGRDSSIVMAGYTDAFGSNSRNSLLLKVDLDGDLIWANSYGKSSRDGHWPTGLVINHEDGYYLLGSSNSFNSNGDYDLYLVKTDGDGKSGCNQADPSFEEKNVSWTGKSVASGSKPSLTVGTGTITPGNWNIKSRSACCNLSKPILSGAHLCLEDTVRIGTSSIPKGYSFNWLYNNQSISTGSNIQIAYGYPGFYDLTISAKGSNCKTQIESIEITNSKKPQTGLDSLYVFCEGEKVELFPGNNLKKTVWLSFQSQQPDTSFSRIYNETDTFLFFSQNATDDCWFNDTIRLHEYPNPSISVYKNDSAFMCDQFTFTLPNKYHYQWNADTALTDTFLTVSDSGWVRVMAKDSICVSYDSVYVGIFPDYPLNLGHDTTICEYDSIEFGVYDANATVNWHDGFFDPIRKENEPRTYIVEAGSPGLCAVFDSFTISNFKIAKSIFGDNDTFNFKTPELFVADSGWLAYFWNTGDTTRQITIDSHAVYVLTVTDSNGCQIIDSLYARKTTGNISKFTKFQLFPNPANTHFYIQNLNGEIINVSIYGLDGQIISSFQNTKNEIEVGHLAKGIYWVRVETTGETLNGLLMKE